MPIGELDVFIVGLSTGEARLCLGERALPEEVVGRLEFAEGICAIGVAGKARGALCCQDNCSVNRPRWL